MNATPMDIGEYAEYRAYLADRYHALKFQDKNFSHRFINRKMGARSAGWFGDVLAGRQKLKPQHVGPMAAVFKLDPRARDFLRVLVDLESAPTPEEKNNAYGKWLEFKGVAQEQIARDRFKYFEHWYYPVLRELLNVEPFGGDYNALAAKVWPPLTPRQAREAVASLKRLGLLNPNSPEPAPILVKKSDSTPHWHKILAAYMELAQPALQKFPKQERDFSALTLTFSPEALQKAGEEIAALRRRLLALSERDSGPRRVHQCLFQVFPVSQTLEANRA